MDFQVFGGAATSDPYITVFADPPGVIDEECSDLKSAVIYKNVNPNWPEALILSVNTSDYAGLRHNAHLFLAVWDYNTTKTHSLIGICVLPFGSILRALRRSRGSYEFDELLLNQGLVGGRLQGNIQVANGALPQNIRVLHGKSAARASRQVLLSSLPGARLQLHIWYQQVPVIGDLLEWGYRRVVLVAVFSLLMLGTVGVIIYYVIIT
jgi:hypothetical protein